VIGLLKSQLGREISIVTFYEAPTVGLLARALKEGSDETPAAVEELERAGTRLEMMQRRREKRGAQPSLEPSR
ncbi:MAG TPA: hypothetical protein VKI41_12015, partial [Vicinamibacteria bacterium]|nr:hypothetical protein [Vicinamibacteria bacterium]